MHQTVKGTFTSSHSESSRPSSSTDWAYCVYIEQLQRVAEKLSAQIQGTFVVTLVCAMFYIILQMLSTEIISWFLISSPRRVLPPFYESALCTTSRLTNAQAWDRFVLVYKDIMRLLVGGLSLEGDTQDAPSSAPAPAPPSAEAKASRLSFFISAYSYCCNSTFTVVIGDTCVRESGNRFSRSRDQSV